ncbi:hypothetical protein IWW55_002784 [Coemansia sp. RSA 2706]|nr:hypothetical protein LPJ70_005795 [Coemansia sp. RSA 2708]KAJ2303717.1 hypothetical protein IWW55_002784 [Coemansia sp. RSA 2706]KAJ2305322.1 hypothetical protein IWW54_005120 [Coemansia sp. RSA 2705]KAJ2311953.1 hypothetical protein IWW52_004989 [Coemansia sp. RSA 2704]KAJ2366931.1 hypothetical protein H4S01_002438 [Coemansia sp. RSA 2610]KAJ2390072.1 hypothetical protein H4S02_002047 [Coemansia sp. RSA 2611]
MSNELSPEAVEQAVGVNAQRNEANAGVAAQALNINPDDVIDAAAIEEFNRLASAENKAPGKASKFDPMHLVNKTYVPASEHAKQKAAGQLTADAESQLFTEELPVPGPVRILKPDTVATQEFDEKRLTVLLDSKDVCKNAYWG